MPINGLIADLAAAFPQRPITRETLNAYVRHLSDLDEAELAVAVNRLVRTSEFLPTIHAIREAVAEDRLGLPTEAEALAQAGQTGIHRHPLVREALDAVGGYYTWKTSTEPGVIRGQFLRIYKELRAAAVVEEVVGNIALERGEVRELRA